ncbi:unnamed protein product, partial [Prorocentrum cordatum]
EPRASGSWSRQSPARRGPRRASTRWTCQTAAMTTRCPPRPCQRPPPRASLRPCPWPRLRRGRPRRRWCCRRAAPQRPSGPRAPPRRCRSACSRWRCRSNGRQPPLVRRLPRRTWPWPRPPRGSRRAAPPRSTRRSTPTSGRSTRTATERTDEDFFSVVSRSRGGSSPRP